MDTNDPWCQYLPDLHRLLADPECSAQIPRDPKRLEHQETCAYWETLHYLLTRIIGWSAPGRGLAWWYRVGKPVAASPHLALVRSIWDADGHLDYYAAWAWQPSVEQSAGELTPADLARVSDQRDEGWWRAFKRRGRSLRYDPFHGGTNPLHLGHSTWGGGGRTKFELLRGAPSSRHAVVIVEKFEHWYQALCSAGDSLPPIKNASWRVDVFDRRVGHLGLFRKSRATSSWFSGKHSIHIQGADSRTR